MIAFMKLKPIGLPLVHLVNVDHIQQVRQLSKGVRIFWNLALGGADDEAAITDYDDYEITMDDLIEKLRQLQVEVLR